MVAPPPERFEDPVHLQPQGSSLPENLGRDEVGATSEEPTYIFRWFQQHFGPAPLSFIREYVASLFAGMYVVQLGRATSVEPLRT